MGFDTSRVIVAARWGGLTGSKAGLSGSTGIGPGVDGVEVEAHFVPNPRVRDTGLDGCGVCGNDGEILPRFIELGVVAAWRIMCSGIAGRGG